jgi:uncharacterized protein (TIGR00661 family)
LKKNGNFNSTGQKKRVLVAPLDWGLGHATRCIPIIFNLIEQQCEVFIAAEGAGKSLLQQEFPQLTFVPLAGYRIQYSNNGKQMPLKLLLQFPKLLYRVYAERKWLKKIVAEYSIDAVISDNRLGLSHKKIPCVYITHQLLIKTGSGFTEQIAQKIHYHFINRYKYCWVPDAAGKVNLAGELSHPDKLPATPLIYIGPLSRFEKYTTDISYDLCIILSGPEPQRSVFEKMIMKELETFNGRVFLVRGQPGNTSANRSTNTTLEIVDHLQADELNKVILRSQMIISRSGYSTIMDLAKLQKPAILIPTPGQTEQEYLALALSNQKLFYTVPQDKFSLQTALQGATEFEFKPFPFPAGDHDEVIENFLRELG